MLEYVKEEKQNTALLAAWCLPAPLLAPREKPPSHHHRGDTEEGEAALWAGGKTGKEDRAGVPPAAERRQESQEKGKVSAWTGDSRVALQSVLQRFHLQVMSLQASQAPFLQARQETPSPYSERVFILF